MRSIGEAFAGDHRRLERSLAAALEGVRASRWDQASRAFAQFRDGIARHIRAEEEALFPAVEGGAETPLTAILRKGHRDLQVFFAELDDALAERDAQECLRIASAVLALLERHDEKEESELYPAAEAKLGAAAAPTIARLKR